MQLTSLKHGGYLIKKVRQNFLPKAWGYCMKKNGQKKPHLPFHMSEGAVGGFLTLVLTKLVILKSDKKLRVIEVLKIQCRLMLAKLIGDF